jgi:ectoine hydroxylase-related dioxygenase (phytanoyl-CoA dioxygenase family)
VSWKGLKRSRAFAGAFRNPAVSGGARRHLRRRRLAATPFGGQIPVTPPGRKPWVLPKGWHMDCGFEQPTWPVFAVKLFAFIGEVGPAGGGTMLLPGSHRLVDRYRSTFETPPVGGKANWHPFLRCHPPLGDLLRGAAQPEGGRSMVGRRYDIEGVPVEVVELTGSRGDTVELTSSPGDAFITHLHVFHSISPNTAAVPRQMLAKAFFAA